MEALANKAGVTDAIVVNTCAVTAEAVRKGKQEIRKLRRAHPGKRLVVTGCAAQVEPQTYAKMAEVDRSLGGQNVRRAVIQTMTMLYDEKSLAMRELHCSPRRESSGVRLLL